tara:strand:- start:163 stop:993 length:831 start_codon:yes stop_codon:yes gene_type:complete
MEDNNLKNDIEEGKSNREIIWTPYYEDIFVDWCDKAMSYRYLHSNSHRYYYKLHVYFTIPVIFISTLTGVANFAQERIPEKYQFYYTMGVGAFNIIAGFITTVSQFLKVNELSEGHRISSICWDKLYRNIKVELAKNPKDREDISLYLKKTKEQYDLLIETSPEINHSEIIKFNKIFKKNDFLRPEICNALISVKETIYKQEENKDEDLKAVQVIKEKRHSAINTLEIENFVLEYKQKNGREPSIEEIYDNLEDCVNKKYIDLFVQRLNKQIEKNL